MCVWFGLFLFMNINELAKFFWLNYPGIKDKYSLEDTENLFKLFNGRYCYKYKNDQLVFVAIYLMVSDEYCDKIEQDSSLLSQPSFIVQCMNNQGINCHFIGALGAGAGNILWCLKQVIKRERPESVSWYKAEMNKLHWIKRRNLCPRPL
jgi:hypothetical protein